jgi:hypothetical protein
VVVSYGLRNFLGSGVQYLIRVEDEAGAAPTRWQAVR